MDVMPIFAASAVIIFIGFIGEYIFQKTNIPDVIWLMILGVVLGHFYDFQASVFAGVAPIFTGFALIFILFEGAINIDIKKLVKGVAGGTSLSVLSFVLSIIIVPLVMSIVGWGFLEGMLLGAIIGGASSAVIIPITKNIDIRPSTGLVLTIESAISDVLCIVGTLTILKIYKLNSIDVGSIIKDIVISFGIAIIIGIVAGLAWIKIQKKLESFSKSYMTTIAALLALYSFVEFIKPNSGAIACLAFGIILGNSKKIFAYKKHHHDEEYKLTPSAKFFFSEISFFVKVFFFVYLGLLISLDNVGLILVGFLLTVLLFLTRPLAVAISHRKTNLDNRDRVFMEILTPKGLAAAVLAQLPVQFGVPYAEQFSTIVLSVIMFSILLSTIGVFLTGKGKFNGVKEMLDLRKFSKKNYRKH
jgi:potassium/hydrogen antiporter